MPPGAAVLALILLAVGHAAATPSTVLAVNGATFNGPHASAGELTGLSVRSDQTTQHASLTGYGSAVDVTTVNKTGQSSPAMGGIVYDRGGDSTTLAEATIKGTGPAAGMDIVVLAIPGQAPPRLRLSSTDSLTRMSTVGQLAETAYVDGTRPTLEASVAGLVHTTTSNVSAIRVEGSFVASVWSWDLELTTTDAQFGYETGVHRRDPVHDPILGSDIAWTQFEQVAILQVTDGWLEIVRLDDGQVAAYQPAVFVNGSGTFSMDGTTGELQSRPVSVMVDSTVYGQGVYAMTLSTDGSRLVAGLNQLQGELSVDGAPVPLSQDGPLRSTAAVTVRPGFGPLWFFGPTLGIIGLFAVAALVKGPASTARFHRLEAQFDAKHYAHVLTRIEPFTHRRRFERRAAFLKVVSLLSLGEFKEASLFLQTLGPRESPEAATKEFLQACAAAGLGQDDTVIGHLSTCFRLDPAYLEEAKTVPALAGYLPYFSLGAGNEGGR